MHPVSSWKLFPGVLFGEGTWRIFFPHENVREFRYPTIHILRFCDGTITLWRYTAEQLRWSQKDTHAVAGVLFGGTRELFWHEKNRGNIPVNFLRIVKPYLPLKSWRRWGHPTQGWDVFLQIPAAHSPARSRWWTPSRIASETERRKENKFTIPLSFTFRLGIAFSLSMSLSARSLYQRLCQYLVQMLSWNEERTDRQTDINHFWHEDYV